jgi:hypothetical protein
VAEHVQNIYGCDVDESGSDVSRASYVSFDRGLWFNPSALILQVHLPNDTQRVERVVSSSRCVAVYGGHLALTCWGWYGRQYANTTPNRHGAVKTHKSLLDLGKAIALHAHKIKVDITQQIIDSAFEAWLAEHRRQGAVLRCSPRQYHAELVLSIQGCKGKPWFEKAVDMWLRWTRHNEFPHGAPTGEKILFAIRQHCADCRTKDFFLGARDAGLVAGASKDTAARDLRKLRMRGHLEKIGVRQHFRHAQTYRLIK